MKKFILFLIPTYCALVTVVAGQTSVDSLLHYDSTLYTVTDGSVASDNDETDAKQEDDNTFISSVLNSSRSPFTSFAAFHFNFFRFRQRGYENNSFDTYINGISIKNLDDAYTPFNTFIGLNEVMRFRESATGLHPVQFSFGNLNAGSYINMTAGIQRKQTTIAYASSNNRFTYQFTVSRGSGFNKRGWAMAYCLNGRFTPEAYIPGTYYISKSGYFAIDKKLNNHVFSLVAFGAQTERGKQGMATDEMYTLAGNSNYNPYWGYQNGKIRNANTVKQLQPWLILSHRYKIAGGFIHTSLAGSFGKKTDTGIDWYNAPDPRPDYYKYLPSSISDSTQKELVYNAMKQDVNSCQINWQTLYDLNRINTATIRDVDGIAGKNITTLLSKYIVENRVNKTFRAIASTHFTTSVGDNSEINGGASYQIQRNEFYKTVNDLLGGEHFINLNRFGDMNTPNNPDAAQNDIDHPNRLLTKDSKYGYDYYFNIHEINAWAQNIYRLRKIDVFIGAQFTHTSYQRDGIIRNGLFPEISGGKSPLYRFFNYSTKAGMTYKINGRNYFFLNTMAGTRAPLINDIFISARTRNSVQDVIVNEQICTAEAGYILRSPKLKMQITGYYTRLRNGMDVLSFYHDDYKSLVNYALNTTGKTHYGIEFGAEYKLLRNITISTAISWGRHFYTGRPNALITADNSAEIIGKETLYTDNYRLSSSPQEICGAGITYRSLKYWMATISGSYARERWGAINPVRRTTKATEEVYEATSLSRDILDQQKLDDVFNLDASVYYSRLVSKYGKKKKYIIFSGSVNNILNNTNTIVSSYEQFRFDFTTKSINKFPPKQSYAYGLTYQASISFRF